MDKIEGLQALMSKTWKIWGLKVLERIRKMALNAELKKDDGIECLNEHEKRLWTPKLRRMVMSPDVEWNIDMMTLSVELKTDDGSKRQTERRWWLWTPKLRDDNGLEHQAKNVDGSERRDWEEIMARNTKRKMLMALNAKTEKR